jgi:hypothetical protein
MKFCIGTPPLTTKDHSASLAFIAPAGEPCAGSRPEARRCMYHAVRVPTVGQCNASNTWHWRFVTYRDEQYSRSHRRTSQCLQYQLQLSNPHDVGVCPGHCTLLQAGIDHLQVAGKGYLGSAGLSISSVWRVKWGDGRAEKPIATLPASPPLTFEHSLFSTMLPRN